MRIRYLPFLCALLLLAGCRVFREAPPLRHYTLGAAVGVEVTAVASGLADLSIGLRNPRLADYLETPFLVVRPHPNQIRFAHQHRWGGSLDREIGRALVEHLGARAPFERVDLVPWPAHAAPDYIIEIEVLRFEAVLPDAPRDGARGEAHLRAGWEIIRALDAEVVASGTLDRRRPGWPAGDFPTLVRLLDEALHDLADELVAQLRAVR